MSMKKSLSTTESGWTITNGAIRRLFEPRKPSRAEARVRDWLHYREGGTREYKISTGERIDIVRHDVFEIIECKRARDWRDAVRQVMEYSRYMPGYTRRIHLFGDIKQDAMRMCAKRCEVDGIKVSYANENDIENDPPQQGGWLFR